MARFPFAIVGFDLDGTLFDTADDLAAAVNHALHEGGRQQLSVDRVRSMMGGGARHMFGQAMAATGDHDDSELRRLFEIMLAYNRENIAVHTRPFPGAVAAIDALAERGVKVAIVTNKLESLSDRLLSELGLRDRFDCLIGGDTLGEGKLKPSPEPIRAMIERCGWGPAAFVGDTSYDILAARNAGIPSVQVRFGLNPEIDPAPDATIDHFDNLVAALDRLGSHAPA